MSRKSVKAALVSSGVIAACLIVLVFPAYTASVGSQAFQSPWQKVLVMIGQESRGQGYTVMAKGGAEVRGGPSSNLVGIKRRDPPNDSQKQQKQQEPAPPPAQGTTKPDK